MKRFLTLILALALLAGLALPAAAEPLFDSNGLTVELLNYEMLRTNATNATLRIYARVVNDTDRVLTLWVDDATVNDVPVTVAGLMLVDPHTDSGADDPMYFYVFTSGEGAEAASDAIENAVVLNGTLRLMDSETKDVLCTQPMNLELAMLDGEQYNYMPTPTPEPTPTPTPEPEIEADFGHGGYSNTAPDYVPVSYDYCTLTKGSKGQAVKDLQQRLLDLGYLNDKVDGSYGSKTAAAVRSFSYQNMDYISGDASPEMQSLLYSSRARYYEEPWIPLLIGEQCKWDPVTSVNTFFFKVQVTNTSKSRTVKGFELSLYYTNLWGEKLDQGVTYTQSMSVMVRPGATEWSNSFNLGNWYSADTVWVGISRMVFDDGEIRDIDDVIYYPCYISRN